VHVRDGKCPEIGNVSVLGGTISHNFDGFQHDFDESLCLHFMVARRIPDEAEEVQPVLKIIP